MDVVYSASDLYSSLAGISLTSLLENNKKQDEINIIIMDNGISDDNKNKLISTAARYNREIRFVPLAESLSGIEINVQKWNISTFGRLFEASSLPDVKKVIHIDCDMIVCDSLEELWEMDMSSSIVAGASDCLSDTYKTNIGLMPEDIYINAGLMVINLERIREKNYEEIFLKYIEKNSGFLTYVDQEVINACVPKSEKIFLPLKYNSYSILHYLSYKQLKRLRNVKHMFSQAEYRNAVDNPSIIHYTGCFLEGTRPWIEGDNHPLKKEFDHYKSISEWKDMPEWRDTRPFVKKIITVLSAILPKIIVTSVIGVVHGVIVPKLNQVKQNRRSS